MKVKLILIPNKPILVSDEDFKVGDLVWDFKDGVIRLVTKFFKDEWCKPIIAGLSGLPSIKNELSEEDLKSCGWIDVERIAMDKLKSKWSHLYTFGYPKRPFPTNYENDLNMVKVGIYESQSFNNNQFTLTDLKTAYLQGKYGGSTQKHMEFEELIKSLKDPKVVYVKIKSETKCYCGHTSWCDCGEDLNKPFIERPKIEENSITITNLYERD